MADRSASEHYETRDIGGRTTALIFGVLLVMVIVPLLVVTSLYGALWHDAEPRRAQTRVPPAEGVTAAPTLQVDPGHYLAAFRREAGERLNGLGWLDRGRGIAHIPIADAMRLHLERSGERGR